MSWDKVIYEYLLGGLDVEFVVSFYIFSLIGMLLSLLVHYESKKKKDKKAGNKREFSFGYWLKDNGVRVLTTILVVFACMRLPEKFGWSGEIDMGFAFMVGLTMDVIIILLRKKSKISLFKTK